MVFFWPIELEFFEILSQLEFSAFMI